MLFFNEKDKKQTLYNEVFRKKDADKFIIITGYTGPQMINDLANLEYDEIILVVGMYGKKISCIFSKWERYSFLLCIKLLMPNKTSG